MADNCTLPNMSGRLNLLNQAFAFFKIVPSAAITMGITVNFVALWTLFISSAKSRCLSTFASSVVRIFWSVGTGMSTSVHFCVPLCTTVISG